ncbi:MAG: hypothetical protein MJ223_01660 [Mycoplasmoidaceae bacterium]|nr:hypothetical protein [Mycoplasmoidaceae bacterium]
MSFGRFEKAIKYIDETIEQLTKVKENLEGSKKQLEHANDKLQDLSIGKLTYKNPTMKKLFDEAKEKSTK